MRKGRGGRGEGEREGVVGLSNFYGEYLST